MNLYKYSLYILLLIIAAYVKANDCNCDFVFSPEEKPIHFIDGQKLNIKPGQTICFKGGTYHYIRLINLTGTKELPIQILNCEGQVKIDLTDRRNHGFVLSNAQNIRISGSGEGELFYGFEIFGDPEDPRQTGMVVSQKVTDIIIEYIRIHNVELGLHLINVPSCDPETWQENWSMEHVEVHDLHVYNTLKEGLYIGSSKYGYGHQLTCDSETMRIQPPLIRNIKVYNNIIENTGWDGFQVSTAIENCQIYNNSCKNYGLQNKPAQRGGIVLGGGSTGWIYNNRIHTGKGDGIDVFGIGDIRIFNNIIVKSDKQAIFVGNRELLKNNLRFFIYNNTIVDAGEDGIRYNNQFAKNSLIANNLLIGSAGRDINLTKVSPGEVIMHRNLSFNNISEPGFSTGKRPEYFPIENSPVVNNGKNTDLFELDFDFYGTTRSNNIDVGAVEFTSNFNRNPVFNGHKISIPLLEKREFSLNLPTQLFSDPDGDDLAFHLINSDNDTVANWVQLEDLKLKGIPPTQSVGEQTVQLICKDGKGGKVTVPVTLVIKPTTLSGLNVQFESLQKADKELIQSYPNPMLKYLLIETQSSEWENAEVYIINMNNEIIHTTNLKNGRVWVDGSNMKQGKYEIKIITNKKIIEKMITKN